VRKPRLIIARCLVGAGVLMLLASLPLLGIAPYVVAAGFALLVVGVFLAPPS